MTMYGPVSRETGIVVLHQLVDGSSRLRDRLEPLTHDPVPSVRRIAQFVLRQN